MASLENHRNHIDEIDSQILALLSARCEHVAAIGELKRGENSAIYRPQRESEIISRLSELAKQTNSALTPAAISAIYKEIFAFSRNLERASRVAFLGPLGTYTHQAACEFFGADSEYLPLAMIEDVFSACEQHLCEFGVVPVENNTEGAVGATLDCLAKSTSVKIYAETYLDIHHSFASQAEKISDIKRIYSHPQGYNQCRAFLEAQGLQAVEFCPCNSTAAAARRAAADANGAAICSKIAAKLANLPLLYERIEDNQANKTRFLLLSTTLAPKVSNCKSSIYAKTANKPGALAELLESFRQNGINLCKIESRPLKDEGFSYSFFIDFLADFNDVAVQNALQGKDIKWLGSYLAK